MFFKRVAQWRTNAVCRIQRAIAVANIYRTTDVPAVTYTPPPPSSGNFSNEEVMAFWKQMTGLAIGSRTPTGFPSWVTLEVYTGGFASGRAASAVDVAGGDQTSADFMANAGVDVLQEMLESGLYYIKHPENAALLVMVWLLKVGRDKEANAIYKEISPYMQVLRFHPYPVTERIGRGSTGASLCTVGEVRADLEELVERFKAAKGHRFDQIRQQGAVADGYAELQGDAIALLLTTVPNREAFLEGTEGGLFTLPLNTEARDDIIARAEALQKEKGSVPGHQKENTTTFVMLDALRKSGSANPTFVSARIRGVAKARGVKGTGKYEQYLIIVRNSAAPDQRVEAKASVVIKRIAPFGDQSRLTNGDLAPLLDPVTQQEDPISCRKQTRCIPENIARIIRRGVEAPLEQLIATKVLNSAESMALVVPQLLSAAVSERIPDLIAREIYAQISIAFSRRRSLLLLNLQSQVKLEELPWAKPLIAMVKKDDTEACDVVVKEVVNCYLTYFPGTIIPNKLVSALKDVMRKGVTSKANLTEQLAADIFQNDFSPNFESATVVAHRLMAKTVYSRYYGLDAVYASSQKLIKMAERKRIDWQKAPVAARRYDTVANGRLIEASMAITTHNLAQLVEKCDGMHTFNFEAATTKAWRDIVRLHKRVPSRNIAWIHRLHAQRDVAYIWRQVLFFITRVGANAGGGERGVTAQLAVLAELRMIAHTLTKGQTAFLDKHFLNPLEKVINGEVHFVDGPASEGSIVLGYYGWASLKKIETTKDAPQDKATSE